MRTALFERKSKERSSPYFLDRLQREIGQYVSDLAADLAVPAIDVQLQIEVLALTFGAHPAVKFRPVIVLLVAHVPLTKKSGGGTSTLQHRCKRACLGSNLTKVVPEAVEVSVLACQETGPAG